MTHQARASHENQHFIPAFLLREWECGRDGKLTVFTRRNGRLVVDRHKAKSVAKVRGIYSFETSHVTAERTAMEKRFFTPIDSNAAQVHRTLAAGPLPVSLHRQDKNWWARFIASLLVRSPWELEALAKVGAAMSDQSPSGFDPPQGYHKDLALYSLTEWIRDGETPEHILNARWAVVPTKRGAEDLLIGDRPVLRYGRLDAAFYMTLPLSPRRLLVISGQEGAARLLTQPPREIVRENNKATAQYAVEAVFAASDAHWKLLDKHFATGPAALGELL